MKKTISIITLGCKVNQYESDSIALALEKKGYNVLHGLEVADAYVINSCAVTNEGERKSRNYVSKILKLNPNAKIYVCGCAAHFAPQKFADKKGVEFVTGTAGKMNIINAITNNLTGVMVQAPTLQYDDTMQSKQTRTRAFLKIQDGCNSFCSYCIIPYLRGRSRSRSIQSIKAELDTIKSREVVFAGVDLSQYGEDLPEKPTLCDVVELMRGRRARFRFSSLEMGTITKELLAKLKTLPNFCPHFHLSMQSGSNTVLKRMNRKHTKQDYEECVQNIRNVFPNAAITTDVICGFPGETEEEFEETLAFCKKINFFEMHIFPYSAREGTVAAKMEQVPKSVSKERTKQLEHLSKIMKAEYLEKQIGQTHEVLVEKIEGQTAEGYTKTYVRTFIENCPKMLKEGDVVECIVTDVNSDFAYAKYQKTI